MWQWPGQRSKNMADGNGIAGARPMAADADLPGSQFGMHRRVLAADPSRCGVGGNAYAPS
jgi:hypothetical protein